MKYRVVFTPEAQADLLELYDYVAARSGEDRALGYVERIEEWINGLNLEARRGTRLDRDCEWPVLSAGSP